MKNKKQIKLSSLSEGLRKEVKKYIKEGKVKLSQMPIKVKRLIEGEIFYGNDGTPYDSNDSYKFNTSSNKIEKTKVYDIGVLPTKEFKKGKYSLHKNYGELKVTLVDNSTSKMKVFKNKQEAINFIKAKEGVDHVKELDQMMESLENKEVYYVVYDYTEGGPNEPEIHGVYTDRKRAHDEAKMIRSSHLTDGIRWPLLGDDAAKVKIAGPETVSIAKQFKRFYEGPAYGQPQNKSFD